MSECLAAVVTAFNEPLELRQVPIPELEPGAMLMRVDAATLCGTDVHFWHGSLPGATLPYIPGHETAGTIVEMSGDRWDVLGKPLQRGDRIVVAYPRCGHCYYCRVVGQENLCRNGLSFGRVRCDRPPYLLGGTAQYHYVPPPSDVIRIPDNVSSPLAASSACALRTALHGFERLGAVATHETVLVQGAGPVGLYAAIVARDRGARTVLMIGAPSERLEVARAVGVDATLNLDEVPDVAARKEWVLDHTDGRGPDIGFQCAVGAAIPEGLDLVRPGGRYVSIGAGPGTITLPASLLSTKYVQVIGVLGAQARHFSQAIELLATRPHIPFDRLLTTRYPLSRVTEALQAMAELREVKPVIEPN